MKKLFLIDGSGYIFRAYHALPPLSSPDGTPVGAVFGFCSMAIKLLESKDIYKDDRLLVVFDAARTTFRQTIYPAYKAHRPEPPEDLIPQFGLIRKACDALSLHHTDSPGFEADDIIASYAKKASADGYDVVIVSSDKDLMQLINDRVSMFDPIKNRVIKESEVLEKFGVGPSQVVDVLALMGDSSDNVPGVPGIGPKTAGQLIQDFQSLDNLYGRMDELKPSKRKEALVGHERLARLSKDLVTLKDDIPLDYSFDQLKLQTVDPEKAMTFFTEHRFLALLKRIPQSPKEEEQNLQTNYRAVTDEKDLDVWVKEAWTRQVIAIDTETTSLNAMQAKLVGISASFEQGKAIYIPVAHKNADQQIPMDVVFEKLRPLLENPAIIKVGHNIKYDRLVLKQHGMDSIANIHDTMLMSYCLDMGRHGHGLDELALCHFRHRMISYEDVTGKGKNQITFDDVPLVQAVPYACEDADICLQLFTLLKSRLFQEKLNTLYERFERPLVDVIVDMEREGIRIDPARLNVLGQEFTQSMDQLEQDIYRRAGKVFNLASPKQLGEVLFDNLKLPAPKKTKTGQYMTDSDTLESLSLQGHTIVDFLLSWRQLAKLKSTYVQGLTDAINPQTHRIHTSYSLVGTNTGRISSSDPNLQNIPVRTTEGQKIRACFVPKDGYALMSFDYSQIELRLLAHVAEVERLIVAFNKHDDIHSLTASQVFGVPLDEVTPDLRRRSKAINFGIIYGISPYGLSQNLKIPQSQAKEYIDQYFLQYPEIRLYMEKMKKMAAEKGYVETLFGRRCHIQSIHDKNPSLRQFAERQAINAPLQGGNADLMKRVMIKVHGMLKNENIQAKLLLQVHDEIIIECPMAEIDIVKDHVTRIMQSAASLRVPLEVGVGVGQNWQDAK